MVGEIGSGQLPIPLLFWPRSVLEVVGDDKCNYNAYSFRHVNSPRVMDCKVTEFSKMVVCCLCS